MVALFQAYVLAPTADRAGGESPNAGHEPSGTAPYRGSARLFRPRPGRLERTCITSIGDGSVAAIWGGRSLSRCASYPAGRLATVNWLLDGGPRKRKLVESQEQLSAALFRRSS